MSMSYLDELKLILREAEVPFFTDEELEYHYAKNGRSVEATAYRCLIIKSEDTTLSISGLSLSDSSNYFRRLAAQYRPSNTGILKG